jgi:hypothetical protein
MLGQLLKRITGGERRFVSPPAAAKLHVGSHISSCQRVTCIDKHWSEMSGNEKIEAGPFLCFVKPDEFDKRFGKFVEFMILYDDYDEYVDLKKFAIESGRLEEYLR